MTTGISRRQVLRLSRGVGLLAVGGAGLVGLDMPDGPPKVAAAPLIHWGYYVTYARDSFTALQANVGAFTHVSPFYFTIEANGTITAKEERETNNLLRQNRVQILPMFKNEPQNAKLTPLIATPEARDKLASDIANIIVERGYDGVNIDLEDIRPEDRPLLSDFMQRVSGKLRPAGKKVTQAVVAKTRDARDGYGGAFDYAALASTVDYVLVMAYDFHYAGGDPGPVAPLNWVRDVVTYSTATYGAAKTILGVPLYGYDWNVSRGGTARAITYEQAVTRFKRPGAKRELDYPSGSEVVRYADDNGDRHEAWFESGATFDAKLRLVRETGIAGFGVWRIGQEDTSVWDVLKKGSNPAARTFSTGPDNANHRFFTETGHNVSNAFKAYFDAGGGVVRFGLPLTEEFTERNATDDKMYAIQYFERARFEYNSTAAKVQLGQIGTETHIVRGKPGGAPLEPAPTNLPPDKQFFPETKHAVAGAFKAFWEQRGGLAQFGYPVGEEVSEGDKTVQYFQRTRFEFNPAGTTMDERVQIALLGTEILRSRGWVG